MSVVVRFHPTNVTQETYDESLRRLEAAGLGDIGIEFSGPPEIFEAHNIIAR